MSVTDPRELVAMTPWTEAFWTGGARGELMINRCGSCSRWFHPPAPVCCWCRSKDVEPTATSGEATIETFTINHYTWSEAFPPPYVIAIVTLAEDSGTRLTTNIVNCAPEAVEIGMRVRATFHEFGHVHVPMFEPAIQRVGG